jgi:isovaleryl-CoA dehydrogenase
MITKQLLSDEAKNIMEVVRVFCEREFKNTLKWDEEEYMPYELWAKMGEIGLTGIMLDSDLGGLGDDLLLAVVIMEEMAVFSPAIGMSLGAHTILAGNVINRSGSIEQKKKYIPSIANGSKIAAICLTEPEVGSDAAHPKTKAIRMGDKYIINGTKTFITNAPHADIFVVYATTDETSEKRNVSAFIVEKGEKGIKIDKIKKMGMRASPTGQVHFENVEVPVANLLGKEGDGVYIMMAGLDVERIGLSGANIGMMKGSLTEATKYAQLRKQFGKHIIKYQLIQEKLAYMFSQLEINRCYLYTLANEWNKTKGGKALRSPTAAIKMHSAEAAVKCAEEAIQVLGGYGYTSENMVQMYWRDAKLYTIGAGTCEMMKLIISRDVETKYTTF